MYDLISYKIHSYAHKANNFLKTFPKDNNMGICLVLEEEYINKIY
jgi:hypothetical protein